jgi:hypothetical protein
MNSASIPPFTTRAHDSIWLNLVAQQVKSLNFGAVEIVIHDSRIIQVQKTERMRLDKLASTKLTVAGK